jgi:hypothetical protein
VDSAPHLRLPSDSLSHVENRFIRHIGVKDYYSVGWVQYGDRVVVLDANVTNEPIFYMAK